MLRKEARKFYFSIVSDSGLFSRNVCAFLRDIYCKLNTAFTLYQGDPITPNYFWAILRELTPIRVWVIEVKANYSPGMMTHRTQKHASILSADRTNHLSRDIGRAGIV